MNQLTYSVPCLFGLEGLVGDELRRMDAADVRVENGRVLFAAESLPWSWRCFALARSACLP